MAKITVGHENSAPIDLYYEDLGAGAPVVLIAGYPFGVASWERQTVALVEAGYRVIAYDRRGFGRSDRPSTGYDFDTLAADLHHLLTALDLRGVTLIGMSMGTGEVTRYIARYGTRRLDKAILIGTIGPFLLKTDDNPEGLDAELFEGLKASLRQDRAGTLLGIIHNACNYDVLGGSLISDRLVEEAWNYATSASPIAAIRSIDAWIEDFRGDLPYNDIPTLILHADEKDRILPPGPSSRRHAKLLKNGRFVEFEDAPHTIHWTHAGRVNAEILAFLGQ